MSAGLEEAQSLSRALYVGAHSPEGDRALRMSIAPAF